MTAKNTSAETPDGRSIHDIHGRRTTLVVPAAGKTRYDQKHCRTNFALAHRAMTLLVPLLVMLLVELGRKKMVHSAAKTLNKKQGEHGTGCKNYG